MKKKCSRCGEEKGLGEFYVARDCAQGRRPECKRCANRYHNEWARARYSPSVRGRYNKTA